ncbi:MAG: DNA processing protein [Sediminicola sp.]
MIAVLRLQSIPNMGDVTAKKLISHCGSAEEVFRNKARHLLKIDGIGSHALRNLQDKVYHEAAIAELEFIQRQNIAYTYFNDLDYPSYLKHCIDSPILLFKRGAIDLQGRKVISVVGTRNITSYGTAFCFTD